MKKLVSIIILCLACLGGLEAQNYWKPIGMQGIFLGAGPDGSLYCYGSSDNGIAITRSQDEGETWQVVLGYETGFNCNLNWNCFSVSPEGRIFLFEGYPYRAFYSDDNGDSWQLTSGAAPLTAGDEAQRICAVNNDTLVGSASSHFVFWTTDGGATWDTIRPAFVEDDQYIGNILANGNGDVFFSLNLNDGGDSGQNIGVYHATLSDMDNWELVAFQGVAINDMEFDPEGNVVCNALVSDNFDGFEHVPGFYAFGSYNTFGIADNGIVYKSIETENNTAVLAYSMDHGETFTEIGEELELYPPVPGSSDGFLCKGYDNFLYFKCRGLYWKSIFSANIVPNKFAPLGAEWYFNVSSFMGSPISYYRMEVLGDTIIQGHTCSVITQHFLGGNGQEQYVYEDNGKVYWYNQTLGRFTTLYDFDAEVGESWTCEIDSCAYEVTVTEITYYEGLDQNHQFRAQRVSYNGELGYFGGGTIIDGIGEISGLFPYPYACVGDIYDGQYPDWLRCYLVDGEMLYHGGDYECDEIVDVPYPSYPFAVGDLLYTIISDNPPQVSVYGHVNGENAQGELVIPETVEYNGGIYTVTTISNRAFYSCEGLTGELVIPNTVTTIQSGAFAYCTGFTGTLVIPNSVIELGTDQTQHTYGGVFSECTGFTHLVLGESLQKIGYSSFLGCEFTGQLVLPEGLKEIWEDAFRSCKGFTGELILPSSLTKIEHYAFSGCDGFTGNLMIPETVEQIGDYVFSECTGLSSIEIPEGWEETSDYMFFMCSNLTSVHLPQSLKIIESGCFKNCTSLSEINIPEGLTEIKGVAFENCSNLQEFVFPDSLVSIGVGAFSHCIGLDGELRIPDFVETIDARAFDSCVGYNRLVLGLSVNRLFESAFDNTQFDSIAIKAIVPPDLLINPYSGVWHFSDSIPIIVPCGTLEAYQNDENWSGFTNIIEDCGTGLVGFSGAEWYYEIENENGSITYQHLEYAADTTVNHKDVQIIIRTNTLYDKDGHSEVTREYIYEEDGLVYWWNGDLQEFTVLYDLGAQVGDSWVIKVGTETLTMHVDAVDYYHYGDQTFRLLEVSDENDIFSGSIVCGIGHLTSFFPERLMTRGKGYRVEGMRCYWRDGELFFKYGEEDCDAVYKEWHNGIGEDGPSTGSGILTVYPNPTHSVLVVETQCLASPSTPTYRITNLMGQTLQSGTLTAETQQIDVSNLPQGMYFISVGDVTRKFIVNK